jgi:16S rRNA (cytosine1402-N4)-methyltransferase
MNTAINQLHVPVLVSEVVENLGNINAKVVVDATFGGGSYTKSFLESGAQKVIAFDRDPDAIKRAEVLRSEYGNRFQIHHACFSEMREFIENNSVDAVVFDFGVSSFQLDDAARGFSFRFNGPLDMRMGLAKTSAAEVVNNFSESDLADIIYFYGDEKKARVIAKAIVAQRALKPFETTLELAILVRGIVKRHDGIDAATLTFQALRIFVNDELKEIQTALQAADSLLVNGGRLIAVSFHALEDRIVKNHCSKNFTSNDVDCTYKKLNSKIVVPSKKELRDNPRSRSAKLRAYVKQVRC